MAKILVIGLGPLLAPGARYLGGQCLRTWHFTRPLLEARHRVELVTCPVDPSLPADQGSKVGDGVEEHEYDGFTYRSFRHRHIPTQLWYLNELIKREQFEAIVAVNTYAGELAYHLETTLPIWCDLNGWVMAEAQARAGFHDSDAMLRPNWRQERAVLLRGDRFSTVSNAQRHAVLGELAAMGRLNRANAGVKLIDVVPNAAAPLHLAEGEKRFENGAPLAAPPMPGGFHFPSDSPIILWSGGFNYWTDTNALALIFNEILKEKHKAHIVVTGGAIKGYGEEVYDRFKESIQRLSDSGRVHLMGWLPAEEMLAWMGAAQIGISYDKASLEAEFGARNRITNMAASALAVVTTRGTEVVADLEAAGAGWFVEPGAIHGFTAACIEALDDPDECWSRSGKAREAAIELYTDSTTVAPLLEWVESPYNAPDNTAKIEESRAEHGGEPDKYWVQQGFNELQRVEMPALWEDLDALRADSRDLNLLRNKLPMRLWRKLRGR